MNTIELKIFKINQPIGNIYIAKLNAYILYTMAKADIIKLSDNKEEYEGIQREIKPEKVKQIKDYLTSIDATFPNSIILNINSDNIITVNDNFIVIKNKENTFQIIDGQHRLKGFENSKGIDFDLNVAFFIDLPSEQQSRVFVTINSEQTKVDPSISFYQERHEKYLTPRKVVADLSITFAKDLESPWKNKIKLIGKKDEISKNGIISLNTFAQGILANIYNDKKDFYTVRNFLIKHNNSLEKLATLDVKKGFFWNFYTENNISAIYKILLNYFISFKNIFKNDWKSENSLLTKTTGYNAMMKLFRDLFLDGLKVGKLNEKYFMERLIGLSELDGTINSDNYGTSGAKASNDLYNNFKKHLSN